MWDRSGKEVIKHIEEYYQNHVGKNYLAGTGNHMSVAEFSIISVGVTLLCKGVVLFLVVLLFTKSKIAVFSQLTAIFFLYDKVFMNSALYRVYDSFQLILTATLLMKIYSQIIFLESMCVDVAWVILNLNCDIFIFKSCEVEVVAEKTILIGSRSFQK